MLPVPILTIVLNTLASEGTVLHQFLSCHFPLPLKKALKNVNLKQLQSKPSQPRRQTNPLGLFFYAMTFRKSPEWF